MTALAAVIDPDGRRVELTAERWAHITRVDGHPDLLRFQQEILNAVECPDERRQGRATNEVWFFAADVGPSRWLQVVVAYERQRASIVAAFPRRTEP